MKKFISIKREYTKYEAWGFLLEQDSRFICSIRQLAGLWKWHRSKVERFIRKLRQESLIETEIKQGKTVIKVVTNNSFVQGDKNKHRDNLETEGEIVFCSKEIRENSGNKTETAESSVCINLEQIAITEGETNSRQFQDDFEDKKEEKKKRSKKRKQEKIKEKPLLKEGKKEKKVFENKISISNPNYQENQLVLDKISGKSSVVKKLLESVVVEDVIDWAKKNLPASVDVEWELAKFKDHQKSCNREEVKDAVAYFRNWLRKALEFQKVNRKNLITKQQIAGSNNNDFKSSYRKTNQNKTSFERFLAGGTRAVTNVLQCRLDRQFNQQIKYGI